MGIKIYGPGHVIAHNSIAYFQWMPCISTYGNSGSDPEGKSLLKYDIYGEDMHLVNDDFIENRWWGTYVRVFN